MASEYHVHHAGAGMQRVMRMANLGVKDILHKFDYIAVTGHSGIVPGAVLAYLYGKQLVIVRKEGECSHGRSVEAPESYWKLTKEERDERTIIVDDFVNSGSTIKRIMEQANVNPVYMVLTYDQREKLVWPEAAKELRLTRENRARYRFLRADEELPSMDPNEGL